MKFKTVGVLIFAFLIFTVGCNSEPKVKPNGFGCTAEFLYNDEKYKGNYKFKKSGEQQLTLTFPKTLSGTELVWNGKNFSVSYNGISAEITNNSVVSASPVFLIKAVLSFLNSNNFKVKNGCISTFSKFGTCKVFVRPDGFIKQIELPQQNFYAYFKNLEYLF